MPFARFRAAATLDVVRLKDQFPPAVIGTVPTSVPLPVPKPPPTRKTSRVSVPDPVVVTDPVKFSVVSSVMKSVDEFPVSVLIEPIVALLILSAIAPLSIVARRSATRRSAYGAARQA